MRAACSIFVQASKNQATIGGCYKDRGTKINGFSSFVNDKNILMYWQPNHGGQWCMGRAIGYWYRAFAHGAGGPGPSAIAPDGWYTVSSSNDWAKERLVVGE